MPKFRVNVCETVWYRYSVEADTEEAAEDKARNIWFNDGDEAVDHGEWLKWRQDVEFSGEVDDFSLEKEEDEDDEDQSFSVGTRGRPRCDGKLVLSPVEKERLIRYFWTEAHPDWIENWLPKDVDPLTGLYNSDSDHEGEESEEMHWDGIQFEEGGRMFDLCMHFVDGKQWAEVYECYRVGDNWNTSTQKVWLMHEELEHDNA